MLNKPFYTIGHSTRPIDEFINILKSANINMLIDIRSLPGSNKNPQYNSESLRNILNKNNIVYKHITALGGLRNKNHLISNDINAYWKNSSFHNYADYATTENFRQGLNELIKLGNKYNCVIMCAEAVWWKCHRRIITDYLIANKKEVFHIISSTNIQKAVMTEKAIINKTGIITYPKN